MTRILGSIAVLLLMAWIVAHLLFLVRTRSRIL